MTALKWNCNFKNYDFEMKTMIKVTLATKPALIFKSSSGLEVVVCENVDCNSSEFHLWLTASHGEKGKCYVNFISSLFSFL